MTPPPVDPLVLWLAPPCLALSVFLLIRSIGGVVRVVRQARLLTAPLTDSQEIELTETGKVVLAIDGPLLSRRHAGLGYELVGPFARQVRARPLLFRAVTSGWSTSSIQLRVFHVERPGRHVLRIRGLGPTRPDDAKHRIVLLRPHLARTVLSIVAITLSAALAIGSLVVLLWGLFGVL